MVVGQAIQKVYQMEMEREHLQEMMLMIQLRIMSELVLLIAQIDAFCGVGSWGGDLLARLSCSMSFQCDVVQCSARILAETIVCGDSDIMCFNEIKSNNNFFLWIKKTVISFQTFSSANSVCNICNRLSSNIIIKKFPVKKRGHQLKHLQLGKLQSRI